MYLILLESVTLLMTFFCFETIVESRTAVKNHTETSPTPFTQFPPKAARQLRYWHWYTTFPSPSRPHFLPFHGHTFLPLASSSSLTSGTTNLFFIVTILSFQECHINRIIQYITLEDWLFTQHNSLESLQSCCMHQGSFHFHCCVVFHGVGEPQLFNHSPNKEHLGCFQFGAITNKAVINIDVYRFGGKHKFSLLWDKCPGVQLLHPLVVGSVVFFKRRPNCFSEWLHHSTFPPTR